MKKLFLIALSLASTQLFSMEKEQTYFPLEQLLPELKAEVIKQVVNAPSINEAINYLQSLRFVNKQLFDLITNNKTTLFGALNSLLKKFPGSEVGIARSLNTKLAQEWLETVNKYASFKVIPTNEQQFNVALEYIQNNNLDSLKKWLNQGYDPKFVQANGWTLESYAIENGSLATLELLSKYNPKLFDTENLKNLILISTQAVSDALQTGRSRTNLLNVYHFLAEKLEQQISNQEASEIISNIFEQVRNRAKQF